MPGLHVLCLLQSSTQEVGNHIVHLLCKLLNLCRCAPAACQVLRGHVPGHLWHPVAQWRQQRRHVVDAELAAAPHQRCKGVRFWHFRRQQAFSSRNQFLLVFGHFTPKRPLPKSCCGFLQRTLLEVLLLVGSNLEPGFTQLSLHEGGNGINIQSIRRVGPLFECRPGQLWNGHIGIFVIKVRILVPFLIQRYFCFRSMIGCGRQRARCPSSPHRAREAHRATLRIQGTLMHLRDGR
mmetsp:Transcript_126567/g.300620  ORF Transcript_126567/g.300620 Transcript_126567/m.300620 type:complete len:236 (-) Transcript_126567:79-786(-)